MTPHRLRDQAPRTLVVAMALQLVSGCAGEASGDGSGGGGDSTAGPGGGGSSSVTTAANGGGSSADGGGDAASTSASAAGGASASSSSTGAGGEPPVEREVHLVGRSVELAPGEPTSSWSNSSVRTRIDGGSLSVDLAGAGGVWFQVVVDGVPTSTFETVGGTSTYSLTAGLPAGPHDIELVRRNEGYFGGVTFLGLVPTGGSLIATPERTRRLAFVGDSLTAGYGIEGTDPCDFSAATESAYSAYAALAARALDADAHVVAFSGKGVIQNYAGNTVEPMPELWSRTLTSDPASVWDHSRWTPHAVVVNLGTNDFSAPLDEGAFVAGYAAFLGEIRATHPAAPIVAVTWAHWGASREALVTEAVVATGDAAISTTRFAIGGDEGLGCDGHTNLVTNARFGAELAATLGDLLGWGV